MAASAQASFDKIMASLKARKFSPVYFLQGEESYFIDEVADYIEDNVLNEGERGFNQTVFYGKETDMVTVTMAARRFPMMSDYQVIIVKEAQNLKDFDKLEPYLANPVASTILVFTYKGKKLDKRTKTAKLLANFEFLDAGKLYENQVPAWAADYLKKRGYTIHERALALVAQSLGNDLGKIANELGKMLVNLEGGPVKHITEKEIEENIGISKDYNVFELQDAIGKRHFTKAIEIVEYFSSSKNQNANIVVVLPQLYSFFSKLYKIHYLRDKSKEAVSSALGINPFFFNDYINYFKNYSSVKIENIFTTLSEFDLKSKGVNSTATPDGELMKEMLVRIFH
jgi:DNA polymerase III subunit delta